MRRLAVLALVLFAACTPAGAAEDSQPFRWCHGPSNSCFPSPLAMTLAETDFVDTAADLLNIPDADRYSSGERYGILSVMLSQAWDHCEGLTKSQAPGEADQRDHYINGNMAPADELNVTMFGVHARLMAAAIEHLCPQHQDLLG